MNTEKAKIVAEIGWNHGGDIAIARDMIASAKAAGADICKFQSWSVANLVSGPWDEDGRREIYNKAELNREKHEELARCCESHGITFMSSCFSPDDVSKLAGLTDHVKIASTEICNVELFDAIVNAGFGNIYVSTGASLLSEIRKCIDYFVDHEVPNVTLLHCVSAYPCTFNDANMNKIDIIKDMIRFACKGFKFHPTKFSYGYSGHCCGIEDALVAIAKRCTVIEKHFTTDNNLPGRDNKFAITPKELGAIVDFNEAHMRLTASTEKNYQCCEWDARRRYRGRWNAK